MLVASLPATAAAAAAVAEAIAAETGDALRVLFEYRGPQRSWARFCVASYSAGEQATFSQAAVAARLPESHWQVRLLVVVKAHGLTVCRVGYQYAMWR